MKAFLIVLEQARAFFVVLFLSPEVLCHLSACGIKHYDARKTILSLYHFKKHVS